MEETGKNMNLIYFPSDLLKEIFLRLPLKYLLKFKAVSKEWRSILESKSFIEMRMNYQKSGKIHRKILAAYNCDCSERPNLTPISGLEDDEEIVYLHCDPARPSMTCDGLVCIPEPDWINVLNPSTGELRRFPSGPDPVPSLVIPRYMWSRERWLSFFPGYWTMGFGRDKVRGIYKVVRMCFDPLECDVLTVSTGEWRKLSPPPFELDVGRRSACVDGSIYWLEVDWGYKILAFDLHTEEFHEVTSLPPPYSVTKKAQILNLDDRLVISMTLNHEMELEIWSMDSEEERWSKTYSISLLHVAMNLHPSTVWWFTPVAVSKEGNVLIIDDQKCLFKHYPLTNVTRRLSSSTCCVISPFLENFVRLQI